jgi:F-type H+-transporting ATPase subunit epsilon
MSQTTQVEIFTPDCLSAQMAAECVVLPASDGDIGVMSGHMRLVTVLKAGKIKITNGNETSFTTISDGIAMIEPTKVKVFTTSAVLETK